MAFPAASEPTLAPCAACPSDSTGWSAPQPSPGTNRLEVRATAAAPSKREKISIAFPASSAAIPRPKKKAGLEMLAMTCGVPQPDTGTNRVATTRLEVDVGNSSHATKQSTALRAASTVSPMLGAEKVPGIGTLPLNVPSWVRKVQTVPPCSVLPTRSRTPSVSRPVYVCRGPRRGDGLKIALLLSVV